ncbi:MAG: thioredoxin domain-containing protein [Brevundimonas sp.]|uniref:thioredoxin domain-containing protein n=1 Tax=Brevundimonas sp. TaxID=1871086 RepID=UPI00271B895A|nr:thioredoxin domain-containing protein [Brevundimonas sp.]MDO9587511.1 thioredoxin domain-containing protein [Brevundimonas sp.]MDP3368686.1 thioredoxin domain-containing protein [Brevundimonas sp.]MDP3655863.1 thioredoxin domain-containing protein [Brevundimonas sp.]MDZ4112259.1 thioredoxin domain-containing protein [Brevundimonas sp.]
MSAKTKFAAMSRRAAMTAAALAAMATLTGCGGGAGEAAAGDMAMGAPGGAKVTVVEYASVTCGVCAAWQNENWDAFKAKYVDTNKVRYVFRELPTGPVNVAVAGFMIARCAGEDRYFDVVHNIMSSQEEWRAGVNPRDTLFRVGNGAGLSNQQIEACIRDPEGLKAADERSRAATKAGVTGTPSFYVNGVQIVSPGSASGPTMEDLSRAIDAELAKG